uniref:Anionic beta-defensin n=1 Tax=Zhangixalus puerensis TaxID=493782 RepID=A0A0R5YYB1_9NEOB|nr:anionic beta-defensin precursor [Zhangixalus puerensis]
MKLFIMLLVFLGLVAITWGTSDGASPALWGCDSFLGYCRIACFAHEASVGQKDCAEGMICCLPNVF